MVRGPLSAGFTLAPGANEGGLLAPNSVVATALDRGDLDSYTLTAIAGQRFQLSVRDAAGPLVPAFSVYDPVGATIVSGVWAPDVATSTTTARLGGVYTVVVSDSYSASGAYELSFTTPAASP